MGQEASPGSVYCTTCGAALPSEAGFCSDCGKEVRVPPRQPTARREPKKSLVPSPLQQSSADPLIGATVAERYVIESMIGRGGMGVVYKVEHAKIGKVMALKLLTGALSRNSETVQRFKREAMMVSKLSHPNTVQVFDYGSAGGLTYLAMEYLSGHDLGELIDRQGPQAFPQMAKIVLQACGALKEAHGYGMVHRDIKPENFFLTRTPSGEELVKVLDFGLAKLRDAPELGQITTSGNIVGTPYYMPPEQVRGEDVDARGDIYSLYALLYTCMTGTYDVDAPTPLGVLTAQLTKDPEPPHLRAPAMQIPIEVSELILKGLQKDPAHRYQSIDELEEAIRAELRGQSQVSLHLESGAFKKVPEQETATRDEVEKYERSLRRREQFARAMGIAVGLALAYGAFHFYRESTKPAVFDGHEREPNHDVATATEVPFGTPVLGKLGRRISPERGDQDNYLVSIPETPGAERTAIHLHLSALPNMPLCAFVFVKGNEKPQRQFCAGEPQRDIDIPQLELRPGDYLFAVRQDLNQYIETDRPLMHENVSDEYQLLIEKATLRPEWEMEPNHDTPSADQLSLAERTEVKGTLSTMKDRDRICASGAGFARFVIYDAEGGMRPVKSALRATPLGGPGDKIPVRIHGGPPGIETTERDQPSPWRSPRVDLSLSPCVTLELAPNPWAPRPHPVWPPASDHAPIVRRDIIHVPTAFAHGGFELGVDI